MSCRSVSYSRWPIDSCSYLIMPIFRLFMITTMIGSLYLTAVTKSCITMVKPPSPHTAIAWRSGSAIPLAIAPGSPQPIVAIQLEMIIF